jgi:hypothetical protein
LEAPDRDDCQAIISNCLIRDDFKICPRNSFPAHIPLQIICGSIRDKIYEVRGVMVMLDLNWWRFTVIRQKLLINRLKTPKF